MLAVYRSFIYPQGQRMFVTESVIDVVLGSDCGWSTVNLIVSQWHRITRSVTEFYVKVHQSTTTLQIFSLNTITHTFKACNQL